MKSIFISHKKSDADFARVLIYELDKAGFGSWIDHDRLYGGDDWRVEIDQGIRDSSALIVVMTPEARASEYVTYEWAFALGVGVKVIPVILKDTPLHPRLQALQHLDFTNLTNRPWDKLINAVKKAVNGHSPITEIAKLRADFYFDKIESAIRGGSWEQGDSITRQALQENTSPPNLRRQLGLSMSDSVCQSFIKEYRREGVNPLYDELYISRYPWTNPLLTYASPASVEKAIYWLKEAQKQGEDQDGAVSAALAKMHGINKQYAAMLGELRKAIATDPVWKEELRGSSSLILLANACIDEPNIQDTLERLREDLNLSTPEETFIHYIKKQYGKVGYHLYWVIGRKDYWIEHKESSPNFPLDILVSPNKEGDVWEAQVSYVVPGNREYIPTQSEYLPVHDLLNQLQKRFFLICPIE